MRPALTLALTIATPVAASAQVEIVDDFRGYPWGTPQSAIPEVAETSQVGEKDGLAIYAATVEYRGRAVLAGFYFHPETGGLVEGAYVVMLDLERCMPFWATVVEAVRDEFPGLVEDATLPSREDAHAPVYDSDCEYFVYNAHRETWRASFANPAPPFDSIELWMKTIERTPRMEIIFRGGSGRAWADARRPPR